MILGANGFAAGNVSSNVLDFSSTWRSATAFVFGPIVCIFALYFFDIPLKVAGNGTKYGIVEV